MEHKNIQSYDGNPLFYAFHPAQKNKRVLVFIHGLSGNHTVWKHSIAYFKKKGYGIVAVDLCGHGNSFKNGPLSRYSLKNLALDIKHILIHEKVTSPVLIGHSLGGMIALQYDMLYPQNAVQLVLIATPPRNPLRYQILPIHYLTPLFKLTALLLGTISKYLKRRTYPYIDYSTLKRYNAITVVFKDLQGTPLNSYMWTVLAMLAFDCIEQLHKIKKPILLITGEYDFAVSQHALREIQKYAPHAILKIMKATDHLNPIRRPQELNSIISKFLERN